MSSPVELLSPAGDIESLQFALKYGADAVYLGAKEFGMRASSANFSVPQLHEAAQLVHAAGRRVYLTLNTIPTNEEISRMPELMLQAQEAGIDAFIVADLGVLSLAKRHTPDIEVHFSTQAGIANHAAAIAAWDLGAKRVVLARELTLDDISDIRCAVPKQLELEVFVHGAMCMSVSGRCLLSQYLTGRDANRGQCAQSCRWLYTLHEPQRPGQAFDIGEDERGSYILSADDLCGAPLLDEIVAAGADSLKIEGRGKSFYYVASATAAYRAALDAVLEAAERKEQYECPVFVREELRRTSHRPYSSGFFKGRQGATQSPDCDAYIREWQVLGVVQQSIEGEILCEQRGKFVLGDEIEVLMPEGRCVTWRPEYILDDNRQPIQATPHTRMMFWLPQVKGETLPAMSILRKATQQEL